MRLLNPFCISIQNNEWIVVNILSRLVKFYPPQSPPIIIMKASMALDSLREAAKKSSFLNGRAIKA